MAKNIKINKLLYLMKDSIEFDQIYADFVKPFKDFDDKNNADIFNTINTFVEMDGDYKKTAKVLYQHENTIRYRIMKAKKILNMEESNLGFIEHISLAIKINSIYESITN